MKAGAVCNRRFSGMPRKLNGGAEYEAARRVVGLGRVDSRARGPGTHPRPHVPAGALLPPDDTGAEGGVDKRRARSENKIGAL
ncbi:MAG: hypothetical protein DMG30_23785 [Acidobacteria bacterium]|nr:MAG: hypothetical protein DMG30_23785 [Acidobacteriota bacterium]